MRILPLVIEEEGGGWWRRRRNVQQTDLIIIYGIVLHLTRCNFYCSLAATTPHHVQCRKNNDGNEINLLP